MDESRIRELEKLESFLRNQLHEMELKYENLHQENLALVEEKCELEEAENDSRLNAQRYHKFTFRTLFKPVGNSDLLFRMQKILKITSWSTEKSINILT